MVGPQLEALVEHNPRAKLRRIDIGSWHSPVAKQYDIRRLPTVWLYEDGAVVSRDTAEIAGRLQQAR